jgi:hypothetical protein
VSFVLFDEIASFMAVLGYEAVLQNDPRRDAEQQTANATFFKAERFRQLDVVHRSRGLFVSGHPQKRLLFSLFSFSFFLFSFFSFFPSFSVFLFFSLFF